MKQGLYSYGDSAGILPDFPFNSLREAEKPITAAKLANWIALQNIFVNTDVEGLFPLMENFQVY